MIKFFDLTVLDIVIVALAGYWSAYVIANLDGPFDIFHLLRMRFQAYDLGHDGLPQTSMGKLLTCPVCLGFYTCLVFLLLVSLDWGFADVIVLVFAIPGIQLLLHILTDRE